MRGKRETPDEPGFSPASLAAATRPVKRLLPRGSCKRGFQASLAIRQDGDACGSAERGGHSGHHAECRRRPGYDGEPKGPKKITLKKVQNLHFLLLVIEGIYHLK